MEFNIKSTKFDEEAIIIQIYQYALKIRMFELTYDAFCSGKKRKCKKFILILLSSEVAAREKGCCSSVLVTAILRCNKQLS